MNEGFNSQGVPYPLRWDDAHCENPNVLRYFICKKGFSSLRVTGHKVFSGQVDITNNASKVETFNGIDLDTVYADQAFIEEPAVFTGANTFTYGQDDLVAFGPDTYLRAETSLTL